MQFKQVYKFSLILLQLVVFSVQAEEQLTNLDISGVWVREIIPGASSAAAYMTIENKGNKPAEIVAAYSDIADITEVHEHIHVDEMMKMRHVPKLVIAPQESVEFAPGGYHLMLMGLTKYPKVGESVRLCLLTSDGKEWHVDGFVKPLSGYE